MKLPSNNALLKSQIYYHGSNTLIYLICLESDNSALVNTFHGFDDACVTLHDVVESKIQQISLDNSSSWIKHTLPDYQWLTLYT